MKAINRLRRWLPLRAERTGFSESLPTAVRRLSQTVNLKQLRDSASNVTYYADTAERQCPALQKRYKLARCFPPAQEQQAGRITGHPVQPRLALPLGLAS